MKTFIKAVEVWAPLTETTTLELVGGFYGEMDSFRAASEQVKFSYDRGLPGKAWAAGHPLVLKEFEGSYFERTEAANAVGITCGIALPVFAGHCLTGVVVFLCGDDRDNVGAIELWHCDNELSYDLKLSDGYFGELEHFEFISRHMSFRKGTGLPGQVWDGGLPVLMQDLGSSHRFIRYEGAQDAGITTGLGIPVNRSAEHTYIMTFLSAKGTPIARQIEVWLSNRDGFGLTFQSGYSCLDINLDEFYAGCFVTPNNGLLGRTFLSGRPELSLKIEEFFAGKKNLEETHELTGAAAISCGLTIPVLDNGICRAVVCCYF